MKMVHGEKGDGDLIMSDLLWLFVLSNTLLVWVLSVNVVQIDDLNCLSWFLEV